MRAVSLALLFNLTHGAQTHMLRAQAFRVELDRIARKHFCVAIVRMRTAAKRHFAKLFALRFAIVGMRYECAGCG